MLEKRRHFVRHFVTLTCKSNARVSPSLCLCENILRWFLARLYIERKLAKILETSPTYSRWRRRRRQLSAIYNGPELCEIYVMLLNVKYFVIAIQCTNLQTEGDRKREEGEGDRDRERQSTAAWRKASCWESLIAIAFLWQFDRRFFDGFDYEK